jgi:uncharacterized protein (DUF2147 family)
MSLPTLRLLAALLILCFALPEVGHSQDVTGKWQTIDDESNEPRSVVEVFEKNGKVFGRIVKLLRKPEEDPDPVCKECDETDDRFNKKVVGMEILRDMAKNEDAFDGGTILDPKNGRVYRCRIWIEGKDLKVRGYWGPFYRTQTWLRAQ